VREELAPAEPVLEEPAPAGPVFEEPAPVEPVQVESAAPAEGEVIFNYRGPTNPLRLHVDGTLFDVQDCKCWTLLNAQQKEQLLCLQLAVATGAINVHPTALQKLYELLDAVKLKCAQAPPQSHPEREWGDHLCSASESGAEEEVVPPPSG
jgi:hypothetical protein